jgi:hypothetical protein
MSAEARSRDIKQLNMIIENQNPVENYTKMKIQE